MIYRSEILALALALGACSSSAGTTDVGTADVGTADVGTADGLDATPDSASPLPVISQVTVEASPKNTLACIVRWQTDRPTRATVRFGAGDTLAYQIAQTDFKKQHRVFVYGMRAQTTYRLQLRATDESDSEAVQDGLSFETGLLPLSVPPATLITLDRARAQPGWQLMNAGFAPEFALAGATALYDLEGNPVWYYVHEPASEGGPSGDAHWLGDGKILVSFGGAGSAGLGDATNVAPSALIIDIEGNVLWRGPDNPIGMAGTTHHMFAPLANGNFLTLRFVVENNVKSDQIVELDDKGAMVWEWNALEQLTPPTCTAPKPCDWTHGNWAILDAAADVVYFNARAISTLFKIDRKTKKVLWRLGNGGDFTIVGNQPRPWFARAHAPELQPNGNILFYDNGTKLRGFSRAIEYKLDESKMEASIVWQYPGAGVTDAWYTDYWGDADRQPNGNTVITAGTWNADGVSRIFEVSSDKTVVWRIDLAAVAGVVHGAYNSERVPLPFDAL